jgi:drug/metabolite transporter (DMT)-like permease
MALAAAGAAAGYLILGRRARGSGPVSRYLWRVNGVAAMVLLGLCLAAGAPLWGYPPSTWAALFGLAAGPHLAGHGLLNLAVRSLQAPAVNLSLAGEPILATLYAAWLLAEMPRRWFYIGAVLVLAGLVVEFLPALRRRRTP